MVERRPSDLATNAAHDTRFGHRGEVALRRDGRRSNATAITATQMPIAPAAMISHRVRWFGAAVPALAVFAALATLVG